MSRYTNTWEYRTGTVTELKLATRLRNSDCLVSIVRHGTSVAPLLLGWAQNLVLPDLQSFWPDGRAAWLESKFKSTCGVMQVMGDLETTGIDQERLDGYLELEQRTAHPVLLAFVQREQNGVYIAELERGRVPAVGKARGVMAYWDLSQLQWVCSYEELMATPAAPLQLQMPLFYPPPDRPHQGRLF